ncbi:MAG: glycosyltransferase involved in cell wall biosynthesis [Flavobacteriales bacterium]|jgi:glycosyltransferase involved in cell wall biosynthesis
MLSILIPVYEYEVSLMVKEVHRQASSLGIDFEIICLNDASFSKNPASELSNFKWIENKTNLGRAKSRNKLVSVAMHRNLLFLDADMQLTNPEFIQNYITHLDASLVICGGISYQKKPPMTGLRLRWNYGNIYESGTALERSKEPYGSFMTGNFLATKEVLENHPFDDTLVIYGHEDTLFGKALLEGGISILHIENPALHAGLEENDVFIEKTKEGLGSLLQMYTEKKITRDYSRIIKTFELLKKSGTPYLVVLSISLLEKLFYPKLLAQGKHIWFFQLLKLKWFLELARKS